MKYKIDIDSILKGSNIYYTVINLNLNLIQRILLKVIRAIRNIKVVTTTSFIQISFDDDTINIFVGIFDNCPRIYEFY